MRSRKHIASGGLIQNKEVNLGYKLAFLWGIVKTVPENISESSPDTWLRGCDWRRLCHSHGLCILGHGYSIHRRTEISNDAVDFLF